MEWLLLIIMSGNIFADLRYENQATCQRAVAVIEQDNRQGHHLNVVAVCIPVDKQTDAPE